MRKKTLCFLSVLASLLIVSTTKTFSQVQIGLHGSRLEGTNASNWGFGGNVKVLFADHFAVGVAVRGYPKNMKTDELNIGGTSYKISRGNTIVPVTGSLDYYFGESFVRPYIGADVGAYFTQNAVTMSSSSGNTGSYNISDKKTYFGAAPRVGINVGTGPVGVFGQAGYNFLFGSGDNKNVTIPGINSSIDSKPTDKFWTFDVGVYLKFGGK